MHVYPDALLVRLSKCMPPARCLRGIRAGMFFTSESFPVVVCLFKLIFREHEPAVCSILGLLAQCCDAVCQLLSLRAWYAALKPPVAVFQGTALLASTPGESSGLQGGKSQFMEERYSHKNKYQPTNRNGQ